MSGIWIAVGTFIASSSAAILDYLNWVYSTTTSAFEHEIRLKERYEADEFESSEFRFVIKRFQLKESDNIRYLLKRSLVPNYGISGVATFTLAFDTPFRQILPLEKSDNEVVRFHRYGIVSGTNPEVGNPFVDSYEVTVPSDEQISTEIYIDVPFSSPADIEKGIWDFITDFRAEMEEIHSPSDSEDKQ